MKNVLFFMEVLTAAYIRRVCVKRATIDDSFETVLTLI